MTAVRISRKTVTTGFAISVMCLMSACLQSTEIATTDGPLIGVWHYTAIQNDPVRETIDGTLTLSRSGATFEGRLDVEVVSPQTGAVRLASGSVAGTSSSGVVDFDASLSTTPRRHVGDIRADTIQGTWIEASAGGVNASGTFRAERRSK
jgi:hypothetical protein